MSIFTSSLLTVVALRTVLLTSSVISDTLSPRSTKSNFGYYPPAEPDYPPMTAYPPSAKLPVSSKMWFENEDLRMPTNSGNGRIYGDQLLVRVSSVPHPDNFKRNNGGELGTISNPAHYYLHGADFEKIKAPTCRLTSCHGPYPNDGSLLINKEKGTSNEECEQIFVQMNGCVAHKGYPIGMVCTICCQCTKQFMNEMSHSREYKDTETYRTRLIPSSRAKRHELARTNNDQSE
ncbi:unnamed protein product [Brugia pahangi]|uniref:Secreted protein n=1 Tax=Brugia pahangi TaxID=6280 RepID=A0A0N4T777_BRUPA|nr:unnamed protein product [Brugia pahangi]